jgi:hypothetical protein
MNRFMLYSVILVGLYGADAIVNQGSVTRGLTSILIDAGKTTQSAMEATAGYMAGRR